MKLCSFYQSAVRLKRNYLLEDFYEIWKSNLAAICYLKIDRTDGICSRDRSGCSFILEKSRAMHTLANCKTNKMAERFWCVEPNLLKIWCVRYLLVLLKGLPMIPFTRSPIFSAISSWKYHNGNHGRLRLTSDDAVKLKFKSGATYSRRFTAKDPEQVVQVSLRHSLIQRDT